MKDIRSQIEDVTPMTLEEKKSIQEKYSRDLETFAKRNAELENSVAQLNEKGEILLVELTKERDNLIKENSEFKDRMRELNNIQEERGALINTNKDLTHELLKLKNNSNLTEIERENRFLKQRHDELTEKLNELTEKLNSIGNHRYLPVDSEPHRKKF